jgi:hypothetical protein
MMEAGLLQERYQWVDRRLAQQYHAYALSADNVDEYISMLNVEPVPLERSVAISEAVPINIDMAILELEEQDSELLARKHNWFQVSVPMDIDLDTEAGIKRQRDETEELYSDKKQKTNPGTDIANQPMDLAAEVSDDEDSICEALENCNIGSQEFMDQFAMDLDD